MRKIKFSKLNLVSTLSYFKCAKRKPFQVFPIVRNFKQSRI